MNIKKLNESLRQIKRCLSEGVAEEIYRQIGKKAFYMMGAKDIVKGNDNGKEYLQFRIGRNSKNVNIIKVEYNRGRDDYNLYFYNLSGGKLKEKSKVKGVYFDQLHSVIEDNTGMALSL